MGCPTWRFRAHYFFLLQKNVVRRRLSFYFQSSLPPSWGRNIFNSSHERNGFFLMKLPGQHCKCVTLDISFHWWPGTRLPVERVSQLSGSENKELEIPDCPFRKEFRILLGVLGTSSSYIPGCLLCRRISAKETEPHYNHQGLGVL